MLKGPLIGLDEDELSSSPTAARAACGPRCGAARRPSAAFADAHGGCSGLLARADFMPPFELYAEVLGPRRPPAAARAGSATRPTTRSTSSSTWRSIYERDHAAVAAGLPALARGRRDGGQARPGAGPRDEVRVMTVHGAKGLQAPIVFLPDTLPRRRTGSTSSLLGGDGRATPAAAAVAAGHGALRRGRGRPARATRATEPGREEYRRLLYVAMTRAEDRLYVCGWKDRARRPRTAGTTRRQRPGSAPTPAGRVRLPPPTAAAVSDDGAASRLTCPQEAAEDDRAAAAGDRAGAAARLGARRRRRRARAAAPAGAVAARRRRAGRALAARAPTRPPLPRGRLVHACCRPCPSWRPERAAARRRYLLARPAHGLSREAHGRDAGETLAVLDDPDFAPLFGPGSRAEVPLRAVVARPRDLRPGRPAGGHGRRGHWSSTTRPTGRRRRTTAGCRPSICGRWRPTAPCCGDLSRTARALRPAVDRRAAPDAARPMRCSTVTRLDRASDPLVDSAQAYQDTLPCATVA